VKFHNVLERNQQKNTKGGVFSKKGGTNRNQTHLGLPRDSNKRRCLLVEATQLAWANLAATTSLFSPINRGKGQSKNVQPFWYLGFSRN